VWRAPHAESRCRDTRQSTGAPLTRPPSPDVADREAFGKRILRIDDVLREPGDPGGAGELRHDGAVRSERRLLEQPSCEDGAEDPLVAERLADPELPAGVQGRHLRAGAGAAPRAVERARPPLRPAPGPSA